VYGDMSSFTFGSGLLDFILGFMVVECLVLAMLFRVGRSSLSPSRCLRTILPGFLLVLGFKLTHNGDIAWLAVACLAGAGLAHAWDLSRQLRAR
jgi:hypothetical protein